MTVIQRGADNSQINDQPAQPTQFAGWLILVGWTGALLLLAYGASLSLPFLADDFFQFPFVDSHTLAEIWQTAEGLYYFRPAAFAYWKIAALLFGYHNAWFLHASNLALHLANALLAAWLADRLWANDAEWIAGQADWPRRFLAASLFILFPFSYEAIPWISAFMHPAMVTLVLLSVLGYSQMRDHAGFGWGILGVSAAFLAPFAHENGVLALPLLAAVEATRVDETRRSIAQRLGLLSLWLLPAAAWFLIWRMEATAVGTGGLGLNNLTVLLRNSAYTLQAAAYPVTWFGVRLSEWLPLSEMAITTLLSLITLVALALIQWRGGGDRRSLLPWLWIAIAGAPAVALLSFSYLQAAPRVLMLPSVGIVWLWSDALRRLPRLLGRYTKFQTVPALIAAGLAVLILLQSLIYIRQQMRTYAAGGALVWDIVAKTVAANEAGQQAVFANLPTWLALPRSYFALGEEGAMLMPTADKMDTLVAVHTGQPAQIVAIEHAATRQEMPYHHGVIAVTPNWPALAAAGAQVFSTRYAPDALFAQPAGSITTSSAADGSSQPLATFGACLALQEAQAIPTGQNADIELAWRQACAVGEEITVFVHILDSEGRLIAQADGDPLAGILPFAQWPEEVLVRDRRFAAVEGQPAVMLIGLYDRFSGERIPAFAADGTLLPDQALRIPFG